MNRKDFLRLAGLLIPLPFIGCGENSSKKEIGSAGIKEKFSFAFMTDVHLGSDNYGDCDNGLRKALADAQQRKVDFVLFGGDNVWANHLKKEEQHIAEKVHEHFKSIVAEFSVPAYFTMGNHDRYHFDNGEPDKTGFKLFERLYGISHHSFDHKGVHFIVLNSMDPDSSGRYSIGLEQLEWLHNDLQGIGKETPIVVSLHVPMLSLYYPVVDGKLLAEDMIVNTKQVIDLLVQYNLKVVLQGHQHIYEEIKERNHWFVTGGSVGASWWNGPLMETEEGYLLVHVDLDNNFSWEYIDYGWDVKVKPQSND